MRVKSTLAFTLAFRAEIWKLSIERYKWVLNGGFSIYVYTKMKYVAWWKIYGKTRYHNDNAHQLIPWNRRLILSFCKEKRIKDAYLQTLPTRSAQEPTQLTPSYFQPDFQTHVWLYHFSCPDNVYRELRLGFIASPGNHPIEKPSESESRDTHLSIRGCPVLLTRNVT